jgi:hypothetical protein
VQANPEAYGADLALISALQQNPRTSDTGLVLLSAVQANPGDFGIPGTNESIVENNVRNDLYRFIQADRGSLPHLVSDLGWFYTPAHGWNWVGSSNPGYLWNAGVANWVLLNPHTKSYNDPNVTSEFGQFVEFWTGFSATSQTPFYGNYPADDQVQTAIPDPNAGSGDGNATPGSGTQSGSGSGFGDLR